MSIADADVVGGTISVADARSGETYVADAIAGKLKLEALKGPFSFQGEANFGGSGYGLRLSSGPLDDKGAATVSVFVLPDPEISITHTGSPSSRSTVVAASTASRATRSYDSPSHFRTTA